MNTSLLSILSSHVIGSLDVGNNMQNSPSEECSSTKLRVTKIKSILLSTLLYIYIRVVNNVLKNVFL